MNTELLNKLQECIRLCSEIESMTQQDADSYSQYLGGDLLEGFRDASQTANERASQIRMMLEQLYSEASKE